MMSTTTATSQATTAEKQGIVVAILGPEGGAGAAAGRCARPGGSLRRTLSADMSSKNWLEQNGFRYSSPMKKIASSKDFSLNPILDSSSSSEDEEEEKGGNCSERSVEIKKEFDIWSSIVSQKAEESSSSSKSLPPPYIHPLVKRSASSLSEKSLQICTESLGSETGSDGFSPSSSEASDSESECCPEKQPREAEAAKFGYYSPSGRKPAAAVRTTSFPPPLPSLSSRCGGDGAPTLLMRSRRDNGRLVVEAVSVPTSHKNFAAQRQDGRLVLMFAGATGAEATGDETDELEEQFGEEETETEIEIEEDDESEEGEEEEEEEEVVDEEEEAMSRVEMVRETRLINFHRLTLMADKRRSNPATAWPKGEEASPAVAAAAAAVAASLPPRPRGPVGRLMPAPAAAKVSTAAAASFNHYEYFWRSKITATAAAGGSCDAKLAGKSQTVENDKRQLVVLRGDGYLVSSLKGCCKEPRRTLIWEPRCIATS